MRRRNLLAAASLLSLSALVLPVAPTVAGEAENIAVVEAYLAAWNARNIDAAVSHFADNVVYFDSSVGTPAEGREAAKGVVTSFINAVPDLKWEMQGEPVASGDRVAFEWTFSGTNTGAWGDGTAATNKAFSFTGASIFEIKDGAIVHQSDYYDALGLYKQLGWL